MKKVTLYTKPGCHLCDAVEQVISRVRSRREFEFERLNILEDGALFEKYKHEIPVVMVDGVELVRYRLTAAQLENALNV